MPEEPIFKCSFCHRPEGVAGTLLGGDYKPSEPRARICADCTERCAEHFMRERMNADTVPREELERGRRG